MLDIQRDAGPGRNTASQVENGREDFDRGRLAPGRAEDQMEITALAIKSGQILTGMVEKGRIGILILFRQGDPGLNTIHLVAVLALRRGGAFGVNHAATRRHPVHIARTDHEILAETVLVTQGAFKQIGDGCQTDMRMGTHINPLTGGKRGRAHLVEENEGADKTLTRRGQNTFDGKPAEIATTADDAFADGGGKIGHGRLLGRSDARYMVRDRENRGQTHQSRWS